MELDTDDFDNLAPGEMLQADDELMDPAMVSTQLGLK